MANTVEFSLDTVRELTFSKSDLEELERARAMPITFDEDCPETTPEQALQFRRVNPVRKTAN